MRRFWLSVMVIVSILIGGVPSGSGAEDVSRDPSTDAARIFMEGVGLYASGDYQGAADVFLSLVEQGRGNGKLYYNIGNAYFKAGDIGRAVLWYEKARRLIPGDPELAFNLAYVETYVKDMAPVEENLLSVLFSWLLRAGHSVLSGLAVAGSALFFLCLFCKNFLRVRVPVFLLITLPVLTGFFSAATALDYYTVSRSDQGIVLTEKVSVKAGFSDLSTELFVLHAGSRVTIEKEQDDFFRIRFGADKIGWVKMAVVGVIQP